MKHRFFAVCAAVVFAAQTAFPVLCNAEFSNTAQSAYAERAQEIIDIFAQKRGGDLFEGLEFGESDRAAICALKLGGGVSESAEEYIENVASTARELINSEEFVRPTELQRAAVVLSAANACPQELADAAAFNNPDFDRQGINAWIWALIAANCSACEAQEGALYTKSDIAHEIISRQLDDGGFALVGSGADADITAAAIYALAPLDDDETVKAALVRAEERLRSLQQPSGGYCSMGTENCESTAQAIIALTALGTDDSDSCLSAAAAALSGYKTADGYSHLSDGAANALATSQALEAFTALALAESGERLYESADVISKENAAVSAESEKSESTENENADNESAENECKESAEDVQPEPLKSSKFGGFHIKLIVSIIAGTAGTAALVLAVVKKKRGSAILGAVLVCAAGGIWALDIKTAEEYYAQSAPSGDICVSVCAECSAALEHIDSIDERVNSADVIPENGIVIERCEVWLSEGDTAYDALTQAAREQRVRVDASETLYGAYVSAIGHISEFGFGEMSGWLYCVNGEYPEVSCGSYTLSQGDVVEFHYSCGELFAETE